MDQQPIKAITVPLTEAEWAIIDEVDTNIIVVPLILQLPNNHDLIIKLEVAGAVKMSYIATHYKYAYRSIFNLYDTAYSIFEDDANTTYYGTQRINLLNTAIISASGGQFDKVPNNYPLSVFRLRDKVMLPIEYYKMNKEI